MANWSDHEKRIAYGMHDNGASSREIGLRLGRSAAAVRAMLRNSGITQSRDEWAAQFSDEAIDRCPTQEWFREDAIVGSARLRDALLRMVA